MTLGLSPKPLKILRELEGLRKTTTVMQAKIEPTVLKILPKLTIHDKRTWFTCDCGLEFFDKEAWAERTHRTRHGNNLVRVAIRQRTCGEKGVGVTKFRYAEVV